MIKIFKITFAFVLMSLLLSCSQILQTVNLDINTEDNSVQEVFNVVEELTIEEAREQKTADYKRGIEKGRAQMLNLFPKTRP